MLTALWSRYYLNQHTSLAQQRFTFFTGRQGISGQGSSNELTHADTNLHESGRVPWSFAFEFDTIVLDGHSWLIAQAREHGVLTFSFLNRSTEIGCFGFCVGDASRLIHRAYNTNMPWVLPANTTFGFDIVFDRYAGTSPEAMSLRLTLLGRGVKPMPTNMLDY